MPSSASHQPAPPRRRADAQRNIERILDAAVEALADDLDVSMGDVARRAGVVRATVYVHYPTREALLDAVAERAFTDVAAVIAAAEPDVGKPSDALRRVVQATWRTLGRYHAVVASTTSRLTPEQLGRRHESVLGPLVPLIRRGQADGTFRADVPPTWHLATLMALIHAASAEVRANRVDDAAGERAVVAGVVGAITAED